MLARELLFPSGVSTDQLMLGAVAQALALADLDEALQAACGAVCTVGGAAGCRLTVQVGGQLGVIQEGGSEGASTAAILPIAGPASGEITAWWTGEPGSLDAVAEQVGRELDVRCYRTQVETARWAASAPDAGWHPFVERLVEVAGGSSGSLLVWKAATGTVQGRAEVGSGCRCARTTGVSHTCPLGVDRGQIAVLGSRRRERPATCAALLADDLVCLPLQPDPSQRGVAVLELTARPGPGALLTLGHHARALENLLPSQAGFEPSGHQIEVRCLGGFSLCVDGREVDPTLFRRRQAVELLQRLCVQTGRALPAEALAEAWWPEADPERQRNRLYGVVHALRATLREAGGNGAADRVRSSGSAYGLALGDGLWIDMVQFRAELARARASRADPAWEARHLERAVGLYRGDLLAGEPTSDWCEAERTAFREAWIDALARLARITEGEVRLDWLRMAVHGAPLREDLHRELIENLLARGRRHDALAQIQRCERSLAQVLGAEPSPATRALHRHILASMLHPR